MRINRIRCLSGAHSLLILLAVAVMMLAMPARRAHAATYPEEAVKAVFLYRIAGYVQWPASMANAPQFTIAVLGADDVAERLKQLLPDQRIQGKSARVIAIDALGEIGDAQMLYVGPEFTGNLNAVLQALKTRPILVVTDQPGALEAGSTVNFLVEQNHVRFEVSTAAARRAGLQIGSGLLAVAEHVKTGNLREKARCLPLGDQNSACFLQLASQAERRRSEAG
jgi:hypothetical protein